MFKRTLESRVYTEEIYKMWVKSVETLVEDTYSEKM